MAQRPKQRVIRIDLSNPIYDAVYEYAASVYPGEPVQSAVYELLQMGMSSDARDAAIRVARNQAYRDTQKMILKEVWGKLDEVKRNLDSLSEAIELNGGGN